MDADRKVARGKTKLLVSYPFWGSLALATKFVEDNTIPTMCTDGRTIRWSRAFVDELSPLNVLFVIAHEILHIALMHPLRVGNRDAKLWNIAADFAINRELIKIFGIDAMPEGGLDDPKYDGMSAEQIYKLLQDMSDDELDNQTGGGQDWDMGGVEEPKNDQGQKLDAAEMDQLEADTKTKVMVAADAAKAIGKIPASVEEMITIMKRSEVDLETVVNKFVGGDKPNDYTFRRINKRDYLMYGMVNRTLENNTVGHTVISIDSSMSVSDTEQEYFLGLVNQFIQSKQPESVTIITWTTSVRNAKTYRKGETVPVIAINDRGGTLVTPVFKYIEQNRIPCDQMIVLSDMQIGDFPDVPPRYPVLWVSSDLRSKPAPWGKSTWMKAA
jgi:predicted metal-dependent peptidase